MTGGAGRFAGANWMSQVTPEQYQAMAQNYHQNHNTAHAPQPAGTGRFAGANWMSRVTPEQYQAMGQAYHQNQHNAQAAAPAPAQRKSRNPFKRFGRFVKRKLGGG